MFVVVAVAARDTTVAEIVVGRRMDCFLSSEAEPAGKMGLW